jgi:hypothetical protein
MYSHLSAAVAAERTEDDLYAAHLHDRVRTASAPAPTLVRSTPDRTPHASGRTALVRWARSRSRRRAARGEARPAGA